MKRESSISKADTLEKIGAFWDTHDFTEHDDPRAPDVQFKIAPHREGKRMNTHALKERYLTDEQGARVAVVLDMGEYEHLLEELEEMRERAEMLTYDPDRDPDKGLKLRADLRAQLEQESADYTAGRLRGKSLEQVERELGLK